MSMIAVEQGGNYVCQVCDRVLTLRRTKKTSPSRVALECVNPSCKHYAQPYWYYLPEHLLTDKVAPDDIL